MDIDIKSALMGLQSELSVVGKASHSLIKPARPNSFKASLKYSSEGLHLGWSGSESLNMSCVIGSSRRSAERFVDAAKDEDVTALLCAVCGMQMPMK